MGPRNERGPGNELGARRAEQFPHLGNYTLTPAHIHFIYTYADSNVVLITRLSVNLTKCRLQKQSLS